MAKQKRKVLGGTEEQSKKRKKAPVEGPGQAPEARPDAGEPGLQAVGAALSPEEQRVLQRKQKKARKQQLRAAGRTAQAAGARPSGAQLALDYLCGWAQKHASWRFQKTRQTWLLLHMFEEDKVPDEHFPTLLAYLEGLRGRARELTLQKAEALMRELDATGSQDSPLDAATQGKTQRLRQVLQLLS